jgi:hypothetical protein
VGFPLKIALAGSAMPIKKSIAPMMKVVLLRVGWKYPIATL